MFSYKRKVATLGAHFKIMLGKKKLKVKKI